MDERIPHGSVTSGPSAPAPGSGRQIRRVLFFGKNMSRSRCTGGLVDALQQHGLDVKWINMATLRRWLGKDRAQRRADKVFRSFQPDMVFVFCRDLPGVLLEDFRRRADVVLWVEEPLDDLDAGLVEYMSHADLVCLSNPQKREMLLERGVSNIAFLMSGFSPRFHSPVPGKRAVRDLVFIGGPGRQGQRASFLAEVSRHFSTEIFGTTLEWERWVRRYPNLRIGKPVGNTGFQKLCATSRVVLGLNQVNKDRLYFSNRTFLTLACRGFHLTHYIPGLETVFENGEHLVWYNDTDECLDKIAKYLEANDERERIAETGQQYVFGEHQYYHRVTRILEILATQTASELRPVVLRPVAASG